MKIVIRGSVQQAQPDVLDFAFWFRLSASEFPNLEQDWAVVVYLQEEDDDADFAFATAGLDTDLVSDEEHMQFSADVVVPALLEVLKSIDTISEESREAVLSEAFDIMLTENPEHIEDFSRHVVGYEYRFNYEFELKTIQYDVTRTVFATTKGLS